MNRRSQISQILESQIAILQNYGWTGENLVGFGKKVTWPDQWRREMAFFLKNVIGTRTEATLNLRAEGFLYGDIPAAFDFTFLFNTSKTFLVTHISCRIPGFSNPAWQVAGICQFTQAANVIENKYHLRPKIVVPKRRGPPCKLPGHHF